MDRPKLPGGPAGEELKRRTLNGSIFLVNEDGNADKNDPSDHRAFHKF